MERAQAASHIRDAAQGEELPDHGVNLKEKKHLAMNFNQTVRDSSWMKRVAL